MTRKIIFILFITFLPSYSKGDSTYHSIDFYASKFKSILNIIQQNYPDSLDLKNITDSTFNYMLKQVAPESAYFSSEHYKELKQNLSGKKIGTGLTIIKIRDTAFIFNIHKELIAQNPEIKTGYKILKINNISVADMSEYDIQQKLLGTKGSVVSLEVLTNNGEIKNISVKRQEYKKEVIPSSFLLTKSGIGYIKFLSFSSNGYDIFNQTILGLEKQGLESLIIDLRDNPGGSVSTLDDIASLFLKKNKYIIKSKTKALENQINRKTAIDGKFSNLPLVVLINKNSASASEVFVGLVQDHDRGLVIGAKSYGKGSVQKYWEFKDSSAIKLTIARYLTPLGRSISKNKSNQNFKLEPSARLNMADSLIDKIEAQMAEFNLKNGLAEVFITPKGKVLLGGGKITPDIMVKQDTTTLLTETLKSKRIIFEYVFSWLVGNRTNIEGSYKDFFHFSAAVNVSDEMLEELHQVSLKQNIWNAEMFETDKEYLRTFVKARIGQVVWGNAAFHYTMLEFDQTYRKALKELPLTN